MLFLTFLFFVCVLLCAGCQKNPKEVKNEIPDFYGFRTDVNTIVNDVNVSANAEYTELDGFVITLTSPESVNGMIIKIKDNECEILYHSLSFFVPVNSMPFDSLCVSLDGCAKNAKTAIYQNGYFVYSYDGNTYNLHIDKETKAFLKITANENEIITFENFQFLYGTD